MLIFRCWPHDGTPIQLHTCAYFRKGKNILFLEKPKDLIATISESSANLLNVNIVANKIEIGIDKGVKLIAICPNKAKTSDKGTSLLKITFTRLKSWNVKRKIMKNNDPNTKGPIKLVMRYL